MLAQAWRGMLEIANALQNVITEGNAAIRSSSNPPLRDEAMEAQAGQWDHRRWQAMVQPAQNRGIGAQDHSSLQHPQVLYFIKHQSRSQINT